MLVPSGVYGHVAFGPIHCQRRRTRRCDRQACDGGGLGPSVSQTAAPPNVATVSAPTANGAMRRQRQNRLGEVVTVAASAGTVSASLMSTEASPMSRCRSLRSFSRQRRNSRRIAAGVCSGRALQSGSLVMMNARVSPTSSPPNARRPVSISYSTPSRGRSAYSAHDDRADPRALVLGRCSMMFRSLCT